MFGACVLGIGLPSVSVGCQRLPVDDEPRDLHSVGDEINATSVRSAGLKMF